jgi:hypothetical protein
MNLAAAGQLRKNFDAQVKRMLADPRSAAFVENFSQQWLQTRAIQDIAINSADIIAQETAPPTGAAGAAPATAGGARAGVPGAAGTPGVAVAPGAPGGVTGVNPAGPGAPGGLAGRGGGRGAPGAGGFGAGRGGRGPTYTGLELTPEVRLAMKQEVEAYFGYVLHEDRSVLEFLDSNYTFVNAALAPVYGINNITGLEMRKVQLPPDSPRGGVLTMGSVLTVTSNPTRTSPVKRGKWILENILGSPTAPPPPNIPALEDSLVKLDHRPTQREVLAIHRESPVCASCHLRMDPLGLAMENFNGFGRFRVTEFMQPIETQGELITGETFAGAADLKKALVKNHKLEFYRTLTGKLMTYVTGRGTEYYDVPTIDLIVNNLDKDGGRFSTLLMGVLESAPVQRCRPAAAVADSDALTTNKGDK